MKVWYISTHYDILTPYVDGDLGERCFWGKGLLPDGTKGNIYLNTQDISL